MLKTKSEKKINTEKQWLFFYEIMVERAEIEGVHVSEISGKRLYGEINSTWFHHILPKSKYPELRYCRENIIMLTSEEHNEVENGKEYEKVEKRKADIQERYHELVEETEFYVKNLLNPIYEHAVKNTTMFSKNQH